MGVAACAPPDGKLECGEEILDGIFPAVILIRNAVCGSALDDFFNDGIHLIDRNGEPDVVDGRLRGRTAGGVFGVGDADDLSVQVEQRAAGIAGVDGRVSLNQLHGVVLRKRHFSVQGADGAGGQGEGEFAQRIADGHHFVSHVCVGGLAQCYRLEPGGVNFQNRYVVIFVVAPHRRLVAFAVVGGNRDGIRPLDHVVVGDDISIGGNDEAGTGSRGLRGVTEHVPGGGFGGDSHRRIHVLGVDLRRRHLFAGIHVFHAHRPVSAVPLQQGSGAGALGNHGTPKAGGTADECAAQHRGDGPFLKSMFFRPLLPRRSVIFMVIPILFIWIDQNEVGVGFVEIIIHGESSFIVVLHLIVPIY